MVEEGDERLAHQSHTVLKAQNLGLLATTQSLQGLLPLEILFKQAYITDSFPSKILELLRTCAKHSRDIILAQCSTRKGLLIYRDTLYVSDDPALQLHLLKEHHDAPSAGHVGRAKTFELLARSYYWPTMCKFVERYMRTYHTSGCSRSKTSRHVPFGVLRPLPVPQKPWTYISIDFVTRLPESKGKDAILVVVDRLSTMKHYIAYHMTTGSEDLARLYIDHIWKLHGLPTSIVSDRGTQFTSKFWKSLCKALKITVAMSSAFHPEIDGQTERANTVMEQYLRS
jgi:hypothetical protein